MFDEIPTNPLNLQRGSVLVATENPVSPGGETGRQFLKALGGDDETFIAILGMRDDCLFGVALGKTPFRQKFQPSWDLEQLSQEITAGVWQVFPAFDSKHHEELLRRLLEISKL